MNTLNNVVEAFQAHTSMSVEQALEEAKGRHLKSVLIIGVYDDNSLSVSSSKLDLKSALWLIEKTRNYTLYQENE